MTTSTEDERLRRLRFAFGEASAALIGDDAAVLEDGWIASVDAAFEDVHFRRRWGFEAIGYRSAMAALSDLAAMGAAARYALSAVAAPKDLSDDALFALARGQRRAMATSGAVMAGGNLSAASELSVSTTVLGYAEAPLLRSGARPGDALWLAGDVGLAGAGLVALERDRVDARRLIAGPTAPQLEDDDALSTCARALLWPHSRIEAMRAIRHDVHAAIDLSDGLALDALRLAQASSLTIVLDDRALHTTALLDACAQLELDPGETALFGGDDYAVLFAAPADRTFSGMRRIGEARKGQPEVLLDRDGSLRSITTTASHDHFRAPERDS